MNRDQDPSWASYYDAFCTINVGVQVRFAVGCGPSESDRLTLDDAGLPSSFAVLTPCNPRGRTVSEVENSVRVREFSGALEQRALAYWPADGGTADGAHMEPGYAIAISREQARKLAVEWKQSAFFWIEGRSVVLCGALVEGQDEVISDPDP